MKLANFRRLISTDFEVDDQKLVEKLGASLNDGIDGLYFVLNNRLTFEDNFLATVKEVEITTGVNGVPVNRTSITLNNTSPVKGTLILAVTNKSNAANLLTGAPFMSFTQSGTSLFIDQITGLQPNNRYIIRFIAFN